MGIFAGTITLAQIAAPGAPSAALAGAGAGNVNNGAHSYKVTFVAGATETEGGTKSDPVTVANSAVNGKVTVSNIPVSTDSGVTARKLYRTAAGADPNVAANYLLLATIADNTTTTYLDNTADGSLGAAAPTTNNTFADTYPQSLADILTAEGLRNANTLSYLAIAEVGGGNLVISSDPDISSESTGYLIGDSTNPLVIPASDNGAIDGALYLYSATAGKQAAIVARSK